MVVSEGKYFSGQTNYVSSEGKYVLETTKTGKLEKLQYLQFIVPNHDPRAAMESMIREDKDNHNKVNNGETSRHRMSDILCFCEKHVIFHIICSKYERYITDCNI